MGWFSRIFGREENAYVGGQETTLQYPDELAIEAKQLYGNQKFGAAVEKYSDAIDKLHTMYVMAARSSRMRTPGPNDLYILDGFESALGAAQASGQVADSEGLREKTVYYLRDITDTIEREGGDGGIYRGAINRILQV
jgi:hypothetical protein